MTRLLRTATAGVAMLLAPFLGACTDEPSDGVLSELSVTVPKPSMAIGEPVQATAVGTDQYNKPIATGEVVWSAIGVATVSASGVVTGTSLGTAVIRATVVGRPMFAERTITITPKPAVRIAPILGGPGLVVRNGKPFSLGFVLVDEDGRFVSRAGVVVTAAYSGGGTISGTLTATTGAIGQATLSGLAITGASGKKQIALSAAGFPAAAAPVTLVSGVPAKIELRQGNNQTATKGDQVGVVSVTVTDVDGYGVPGATVNFAIGQGGGTVSGTALATNAEGITGVFDWRLGSTGLNTLIATAQGVSTPVTISATALPRVVSVQLSRTASSVAVGQSIQLTLQGTDDTGAPYVPPVVQWLVESNLHAIITPAGVLTGTSAGNATVIVVAGGARTSMIVPVTGSATRRLQVVAYPPVAVNGVPFAVQPAVQVVDVITSQPVAEAGHVVTASNIGPSWNADQTVFSLGTLTGPTTAVTDAAGVARFAGLGVVSQQYAVVMTFRSEGSIPVTSGITAITPGAPASIIVEAGDNQSAAAGTEVTTRPTVIVRDVAGVPVPGVSVTFAVLSGSGSLTGATVVTDAAGKATVGSWTLAAIGANSLIVSVTASQASATIRATARPF